MVGCVKRVRDSTENAICMEIRLGSKQVVELSGAKISV